MPSLYLSEIFGPTLQGEGPSVGTPAAFLRVAGCNLACAWCDTPYTWDWTRFDNAVEVSQTSPEDAAHRLVDHLPSTPCPLVVVTGGEPMLQQLALAQMTSFLRRPVRVEVETAGTVKPGVFDAAVDQYIVSLKLTHSGNHRNKAVRPAVIEALNATGRAAWKFVVREPSDLDEVATLVGRFRLGGEVFIMPEGATRDELERRGPTIVREVIAHGWRYTPRLHVDLWDGERSH